MNSPSGTKLRPGLKITELIKQAEFENSNSAPLLFRSRSRCQDWSKKRWEKLNPILIQAEIHAAAKKTS
jgi:hypothetical protein